MSSRLVRGVGQSELAKQAKVHRTAIARAELGQPCRASTLRKIAIALGFTLTWVRRPFLGPKPYRIDRQDETLWVASNPSFIRKRGIPIWKSLRDSVERDRLGSLGLANAFIRVMNNDLPGGRIHALVVESYRKELDPVSFPGQLFLFVLKGRILVQVGDDSFELGEGDSVSYWNDIPNLYEALDGKPATILEVFVDMSAEDLSIRDILAKRFPRR